MMVFLLRIPKIVFAITFLLLVTISIWSGSRYHRDHEVDFITIEGEINGDQRQEVLAHLATHPLSKMSIDQIRSQLEMKQWISSVTIKKQWPDSLTVGVYPEIAIALWNDAGFINENGDIFQSDYVDMKGLAKLYGPESTEREVMRHYQQINAALLSVNQSIGLIQLDMRGSWMFESNQGFKVLLGKEELVERLQRFIKVSSEITTKLSKVDVIDTRYAGGVAVSWKNFNVSKSDNRAEDIALANTFNTQREQKL